MDKEVLARRQKDLEGFTEYYQERLDTMVGNYAKDLAPAWQRMSDQLEKEVENLYKKAGAIDDPAKIKALLNKAQNLNNLKKQLDKDLRLSSSLADQAERLQPLFTTALGNAFEDGYYFTAWGLEQASRVGVSVPLLTKNAVLGVIANPWLPDGANYSSRIRTNAAYIAQKARDTVAKAVAKGWGVNEAARAMRDVTGEGYFRNVTLMRTELNRAASLGSSYLFMENADVLDGKRWNATLDSRTAPKDADNDGEIYDLDYDTPVNPGVPGQRIPNHPNCRCKYSPVLSALGVSDKERIAREGDGPDSWGRNTYTKARTYREYAKQRGLPDLDERLAKDNPKQYLRPGESMADFNKKVVRWNAKGGTVTVPKPYWEEAAPVIPPVLPTTTATTFTPAKSIKEAEEFAKQFAEVVDYRKIDLEVANLVNEELFYQTQANPLPNKFNIIGEMKDINKMLGNTTTKKSVENTFMSINSTREIIDGKPSGPIKAYFSINKKNAGTMADVNEYIKKLTAQGVIKNPTARGLIAHEYGHLIDTYNPVGSWTSISDTLYDAFLAAKRETYGQLEKHIKENVGSYMLHNKSEFFGEAYRLYTHDLLTDELAFIDDFFSSKGFKKVTGLKEEIEDVVNTWADAVKARIAKGIETEVDVREVGAMVRERIEAYTDNINKRRADLDKQKDEIIDKLNAFDPKDYYSKAYTDLEAELTKVVNESEALFDKLLLDNPADNIKAALSEIRPIGPKDAKDLQPFIAGSNGEAKEAVEVARQYLPTDWLEASNSRPMKAKKVKRGFYHEAVFKDDAALKKAGYTLDQLKRYKRMDLVEDAIALSGSMGKGFDSSMVRCAFHEMGHRMEDMIPAIRKLEKQFYARRTAGEALKWLGPGYKKDEVTRFDNFLNPYMGKDYGNKEDSFYELLSMGLESVFKQRFRLKDDTDYADFIYGILAAL